MNDQPSNDDGSSSQPAAAGVSAGSTGVTAMAPLRSPLGDKSNVSNNGAVGGELSTKSIKQQIPASGGVNSKVSTTAATPSARPPASLPKATTLPKPKFSTSLDDDSSDDEDDALLTMSSGLGGKKAATTAGSSVNTLDRKPAAAKKTSVLLSKPKPPPRPQVSMSTTPSYGHAIPSSLSTSRPDAVASSTSWSSSLPLPPVPSVASLPRPSTAVSSAMSATSSSISQAVASASRAVAHLKNVPVPVLSTSLPDSPTTYNYAAAAAPSNEPKGFTDQDDVKNYGSKDWKDMQKEYDDVLTQQETDRMKDVPQRSMPKRLQAKLFSYQEDGVRWLVHKETTFDEIPPFYKEVKPQYGNGKTRYFCSLRKQSYFERPLPTRGSILADDMGLGKTVQTIGLIMSNPPVGRDGKKRYPYKRPLTQVQPPRCTLIVSPVSVMSNWKMELNKFVNKDKDILQVDFYRGASREKMIYRLKNQEIDILIASYQTLMHDFRKYEEHLKEQKKRKASGKPLRSSDKSFIHDLTFHRIVLDEAHTIRNGNSITFRAVNALKANNRLCLTGTPFVNNPKDIRSLFQFLQVDVLKEKNHFQQQIVAPIEAKQEIGLALTRVVMGQITLRRTKAQVEHLVKLPNRTLELRTIEFDGCLHDTTHKSLYEAARLAFLGLLQADGQTIYKNYYLMFALVLRVRQACCHGGLVPLEDRERYAEFTEEFESMNLDVQDLDREEGLRLFQRLAQVLKKNTDNQEEGQQQDEGEQPPPECAVCLEELVESSAMILRTCEHVFCQPCLDKITNHTCPLCRKSYSPSDQVSKDRLQDAVENGPEPSEDAKPQPSSDIGEFPVPPKLEALMEAIEEMEPDEKGVIFSQWTSHLNLIGDELKKRGHTFCRIQGGMSVDQRLHAMEIFSSEDAEYHQDNNPRFMLCSLMACGVGITLTRANHIYMMDPWWNAAAENQAMDRIYRIGQTRDVRAIRFLMKDSIEERMVRLQDAKEALGKGSLQKLRPEERGRAKLTAMKDLFEVEDTVEVWEGHYDDDQLDEEQRWLQRRYRNPPQSTRSRRSVASDERSYEDEDDDGEDLDDFIVDDDASLGHYGDEDEEYRPKEKKRKGRKGKATASAASSKSKKKRKNYFEESDSDDDDELELYYDKEDSKPAAVEKEESVPMEVAAPEVTASAADAPAAASKEDSFDDDSNVPSAGAKMEDDSSEVAQGSSISAATGDTADANIVNAATKDDDSEAPSAGGSTEEEDKSGAAEQATISFVTEETGDSNAVTATKDDHLNDDGDVTMASDESAAEVTASDGDAADTSSSDGTKESDLEEKPQSSSEEVKKNSPAVTRSRRAKRDKVATPDPPLRRSTRRRAA